MIAFGRIYENLVFLIHFDKKIHSAFANVKYFLYLCIRIIMCSREYVEVMRMNGDCG